MYSWHLRFAGSCPGRGTFKFNAVHTIAMARTMGLLYLIILVIMQSFASAHMIDVVAGRKECFFEDLHKNDKVCRVLSHCHWHMCLCYPR